MLCKNCKTELTHVFVDLNYSPIANEMLRIDQLNEAEKHYPLKVFICDKCFLVQLDEFKANFGLFNSEYTYFSSFSKSWLKAASDYVDMIVNRFKYDSNSFVIEIASNDGYLLKNFIKYNIPFLGIDPTANTAMAADKNGVKTLVEFFTSDLAENRLLNEYPKADLIIGNNVLAHVPDIIDFVKGMKIVLNENGIITMEFPHFLNLLNLLQFDTIYHEHFSYLSLTAVNDIFTNCDLKIFDVELLGSHGGSLRIFATHEENINFEITHEVKDLLEEEFKSGIKDIESYKGFNHKVNSIKYAAISFLIDQKTAGKKIIAYGAAAKGNTFLNYCGIQGTDLIEVVVDASPYKQNKYLPGSHIPVVDESIIEELKPDYVIILPWNLKDEISDQLSYIRNWDGKFVTFLPDLKIF